MNTDREQRVSLLAHRIWEAEGKPSGQETRHWYMALKLVEAAERVVEVENGANNELSSSRDAKS
jgi:hypothetical protein